jgi:hypothetical protein
MAAGPGKNGSLVVLESVPTCLNIAQVLLGIVPLDYHSQPFLYHSSTIPPFRDYSTGRMRVQVETEPLAFKSILRAL